MLDLEDAVTPDAKAEARSRVCDLVLSGAYGSTIGHPGQRPRHRLARRRPEAPSPPPAAAVVVPKVNSVEDVRKIEDGLVSGSTAEATKIWAMVETPVAMLHAEEIAAASDRLTVLVMGTNDLEGLRRSTY
ncbi:MAG: aldolase/citrate lyase family protein [Acidimicrobiales bacterium]